MPSEVAGSKTTASDQAAHELAAATSADATTARACHASSPEVVPTVSSALKVARCMAVVAVTAWADGVLVGISDPSPSASPLASSTTLAIASSARMGSDSLSLGSPSNAPR